VIKILFQYIATFVTLLLVDYDGEGVDHCTINYATLGSHGEIVWHKSKRPIVLESRFSVRGAGVRISSSAFYSKDLDILLVLLQENN